jgi:hypothetical protein
MQSLDCPQEASLPHPLSHDPIGDETKECQMADRELRRVRDTSDDLLDNLNRLKTLEERKRRLEVSTPEFHEAADAIAGVSSDIFRLARDERAAGDRISRRQGVSTEDVEPDR